MREVEIKAHVSEPLRIKHYFDEKLGSGVAVDKRDQYFKATQEIRAIRVRSNNGKTEITVKKRGEKNGVENNEEFELSLLSSFEDAIRFFVASGYQKHFNKYKSGWQWYYDNAVHIELLKVNDLGYFLELEYLIPLESSEEKIIEAMNKLYYVLQLAGLKEEDIERRSYRSMIVGD